MPIAEFDYYCYDSKKGYHGNYSNGFSLEKTESIWSIEYTIKSWDIGITVIKRMGHNQ